MCGFSPGRLFKQKITHSHCYIYNIESWKEMMLFVELGKTQSERYFQSVTQAIDKSRTYSPTV